MTVFTGHTGNAGHFLQPTASAMGHRTTLFSPVTATSSIRAFAGLAARLCRLIRKSAAWSGTSRGEVMQLHWNQLYNAEDGHEMKTHVNRRAVDLTRVAVADRSKNVASLAMAAHNCSGAKCA